MIVGIRAHDLVKGNIDYVLSQAKEYGFDAVQLVFKKALLDESGKNISFNEKTKNEVKEALINWFKVRQDIKTLQEDEKAVFLSLQRKRITPRAVENLVKKYSQAVTPLKKISPHKLRSTYGTNLYRETQDIYIVADVLGHKDVNTTKKHYAAISEDIRRNASTKVKLR